ncbi:MAG: hypothetical protein IPN66_08425 [Candidatus Competibacteraceae bacterium]|nr:hypothetical protein [Candidatus Competibacteraceae bacterium]
MALVVRHDAGPRPNGPQHHAVGVHGPRRIARDDPLVVQELAIDQFGSQADIAHGHLDVVGAERQHRSASLSASSRISSSTPLRDL